jgi:hypothetical protein
MRKIFLGIFAFTLFSFASDGGKKKAKRAKAKVECTRNCTKDCKDNMH